MAIWLAKNVPFTPNVVISHKEGRYVLAAGKINEHTVTFISYYAPNTGQVLFFNKMFKVLMAMWWAT